MVYGENIVVPGEFFPTELDSHTAELQRARYSAAQFRPICPRRSHREKHVPPVLASCDLVFIRQDAHRPPLTAPYKGPFKVLKRAAKAYYLQLQYGRNDWVSVDRLKPAYMDADCSSFISSSSGRPLRAPDWFVPS